MPVGAMLVGDTTDGALDRRGPPGGSRTTGRDGST
jgi:hypothetical protein